MIISIDVGTSYSSICISGPDGKAQPVNTSTGTSMYGDKYSLPSAVFVEDNGDVLVGQAAMNSRKRKPQNFQMEFKRDIGQDIPVLLGNVSFMPEDFYTEIFKHMIDCLGKVSSEPIEQIYLTCPAAFGKKKKEKIIAAAKAAGLFDAELVDEPTAAAMSYCAEGFLEDGQNLMVYDFGGGTFDVSLIHYADGEFRQLAEPHGLERCGGIDMDRMIFQDILSNIDAEMLEQLNDNNLYRLRLDTRLAELAIKAKHHLSSAKIFEEDIEIGLDMISYRLTLEKFNGMIAGLVGQTIAACREMLQSAGLAAPDLSAVLMVGGTSRVPLVQDMVKQFAGDVPVLYSDDLELAVAKGALNFYTYQGQIEELGDCTDKVKRYWNAAVRGDAEAQLQLGGCYEKGDGIIEDKEKAVKWYLKSAEQGTADAQYKLGLCYANGEGVEEDKTEAVKWYRKSAEQGYMYAQNNLGVCYANGKGVKEDKTEAVKWYRKSAEQGNATAQCNLGQCYDNGTGVAEDKAEAVKWYRKSAEQGNATAQYNLGLYYWYGKGVKENSEEAVKRYRNPVKQGFMNAVHLLGRLHEEGMGKAEAVKWYRKSAEQGHASAQNFLGWCYENGTGVAEDKAEAVKWYRKSAEQGNATAQCNLGLCYDNGTGVAEDKAEAVKWYRKSAEQNHARAQNNLGDCYFYGSGVKLDREEAVKWYRKSAEQGNASAQYNLGWCYAHGVWVKKDKRTAIQLYKMAANQGNEAAEKELMKAGIKEMAFRAAFRIPPFM